MFDELDTFNEDDFILKAVVTLSDQPAGVLHAITNYDPDTKLYYRIDPENEGARTKRHIHIWKKNNKNNGVAWNVDGSRHDKGSFTDNFKYLNAAKNLAEKMLNANPNIPYELLLPRDVAYENWVRMLEIILEILLSPDDEECLHFYFGAH
ncbi:DUF6367 family protein [Citrobacter werkmanii]|uniref:DUF6367 family protein n=1 Tax=Citrobacter werkmanii TaxID=67827 RepID=UPI0009A23CCD|nr:DUF6367 family protein [Citrobacter werkmanii]HCR3446978.1 hypothetical protein [Citrobacter werkmanii]